MQTKFNANAKAKSNLKIIAGGGAVKQTSLRAGGLEPSETMAPGLYVATCKGAIVTSKGKNTLAVLEFHVMEGPEGGTALRQWITIPVVGGNVPLASRYARQCKIALGREIEPGDNLDPAAIFEGRIFQVDVGYRMTEKIGGTPDPELKKRRKDAKDFLRVHAILAAVEWE